MKNVNDNKNITINTVMKRINVKGCMMMKRRKRESMHQQQQQQQQTKQIIMKNGM
jgi:predicted transcriptional regulator